MNFLQKWLAPKVIEEVNSKYSGKLEVMRGSGYYYVKTGIWSQSGGIISDVWKDVIKKIGKKNKRWLILGLAGGSVAKLIPNPSEMIGVEIDPEMIRIGKQYLGLDKIKNLKIINKDAYKYLKQRLTKFDYILVDVYLGDKLPKFVYTTNFIKRLRVLGKIVVFNHLFLDENMREEARKLVLQLGNYFSDIKMHRVLTNLMIICA